MPNGTANPVKYLLAQLRIAHGHWMPDPGAGVLRSAKTGRPLETRTGDYVCAALYNPFTQKNSLVAVHRVLWESVHGLIADRDVINHRDGDKHNNKISNLERVTVGANNAHARETGLSANRGERVWNSRITDETAAAIISVLAAEPKATYHQVAERFNAPLATVGNIARGRSFRHLPRPAESARLSVDERRALAREKAEYVLRLRSEGVRRKEIVERTGVSAAEVHRIMARGTARGVVAPPDAISTESTVKEAGTLF